MKIKPEHFNYLQKAINDFLEKYPDFIGKYEKGEFRNSHKVHDLQTRFSYDILHYAGLLPWVCKELYPYMNDEHLHTALKRICPKIERRY